MSDNALRAFQLWQLDERHRFVIPMRGFSETGAPKQTLIYHDPYCTESEKGPYFFGNLFA